MKKIYSAGLLIATSVTLVLGFIFSYPYMIAYRGTEYAERFNRDTFESIAIGTPASEMETKMGSALATTVDDRSKETRYFFSRSTHDSHYFEKTIVVKDGKVVEKVDQLYFD